MPEPLPWLQRVLLQALSEIQMESNRKRKAVGKLAKLVLPLIDAISLINRSGSDTPPAH